MLKRRGILFCLVGPAGSGKTSHGEELLKSHQGSLAYSVSVTTRAPRAAEQEGVHYFFVSKEEFKRRVDAGLFFEWEEVHGNCYGTLKSAVDDSIKNGKDLLLDIDIKGALNFKRNYPDDTVIVFLVPPSVEALKSRVINRGTVSDAEMRKRLETAKSEYAVLLGKDQMNESIDYFVVNDDRAETFSRVLSILDAERHRVRRLDKKSVQAICTLE